VSKTDFTGPIIS